MAEEIILKINNMHCTSCAMGIDGELEDADGVLEATTSYAKAETKVKFDPEKISVDALKSVIKKAGYDAELK